jgi:hypothetical protein
MLQEIRPLDPDFPMIKFYCEALDVLGKLYASLKQDGLTPAFYIRVVCWPSFLTEEFATCAKEQRPRALIILAHYLTFIKIVSGLWWIEGIGERDIAAIGRILGPMWFPYLNVPLQAIKMDSQEEVANLLLAS